MKPLAPTFGRCRLALLFGGLLALGPVLWAQQGADQLEFFEKRIRPVLTDQCYKCHSSSAQKLKGGLLLDSREAALKGGDTGPAVAPGNLEKSLLIEAIHWGNKDLQMPPKKRLSGEQVADLETWVARGAFWPPETGTRTAAKQVFDLSKRKAEHWCWQPVVRRTPPEVQQPAWPSNDLDRFILAKLESKGLHPAPPADARTLLRRVTFDLTGLPPTPEEVTSFIQDPSPQAWAQVVDRLLSSPHYGERWARHWLDLVRYAETRGHEIDPEIPNAWQYRDYVIRALNADLPYNQFVLEHLAGDLMKTPRLHPQTGGDESILGTGFWFLGEEVHSPVDIRQDETDRMDNRLDVMGKTFLGLTVGCARCHDHKFDAISQRDYYALEGFLISSGYRQVRFETLERHRKIALELDTARAAARPRLLESVAQALAPAVAEAGQTLLAVNELANGASDAQSTPDTERLGKWLPELKTAQADPGHPLHRFAVTAAGPKRGLAKKPTVHQADDVAEPRLGADRIVLDYAAGRPEDWLQDGWSFGTRPRVVGDLRFGDQPGQPLLGIFTRAAAERDLAWKSLAVQGAARDLGKLGTWERSEQTLRTPDFALSGERLWYLVRGGGRAYAAVNSHLIIHGPLHGALLTEWKPEGAGWHWVKHELPTYSGHRLHVEFSPLGDGELGVAMVAQGQERPPLPAVVTASRQAPGGESEGSPESVARATQEALEHARQCIATNDLADPAIATVADWLVRKMELFVPPASPAAKALAGSAEGFIVRQKELLARIQKNSPTAPAMFEGSGANEFVLVRGQSKTPGPQVPRRFLEALGGTEQPPITGGSGRLALAQQIANPANPLTARVLVNRVWHHLFGRGIVPTVDNFGVLGQPPSHLELLDYLAAQFVQEQGWSVKQLIRELVLSQTYRMASSPSDSAAEEADPQNALLHRMNPRRLEGEAIRDEILAVSGGLDPTVGGPSIPVFLTAFMDGRGRPASGPLDGARRRSIYTAVRRNFLSPMMLAFDTPIPFNTMGRRNVSNVPAQALTLMNDPFVVNQARRWAQCLPRDESVEQKVTRMYATAFSRPPTRAELTDAEQFLQEQAAAYATPDKDDERLWSDLAHVLFNVKEFIYVN